MGANSLVSREVPPRCLTAGFPARVVAKAPEFPKELDQDEKVGILKNIVSEMTEFFKNSGMSITEKAGSLEFTWNRKKLFGVKSNSGRMRVSYNTEDRNFPEPEDNINVYLSLDRISDEHRKQLNHQNTMWIEIERKEQSSYSNELGDEVSNFLKRYGVRTIRV